MATSTISTEQAGVVIINVFTVAPEYQDKLIEILENATEQVMKYIPGFISSNIHKSLDGTKVTNYAQWESEEAVRAMLRDPQATAHRHEIRALASPEGAMYKVTRVVHSSESLPSYSIV